MALIRLASTRQLAARLAPRIHPLPLVRALATAAPALRTERRPPARDGKHNNGKFRLKDRTRARPPLKHAAPKVLVMRPEGLPLAISSRLGTWARSPRVAVRLKDYGFTEDEAEPVAAEWLAKATSELKALDTSSSTILDDVAALGWDPQSLILAYESGSSASVFEAAFMRHFLEFATASGPQHLRLHLRSILEVTNISNLAQTFNAARRVSRHFHLHMGPTNSGKTYNALKALSKAGLGRAQDEPLLLPLLFHVSSTHASRVPSVAPAS